MDVLRSSLAWLCAVAVCVSAGFAGEEAFVFTLRDHIDRTWRNELVTFHFETAGEPCHPESITLVGPKGRLPAQLANIAYGPDRSSVRSADVSFVVPRLDALQSTDYVVRYGPRPVSAAAPAAKLEVLEEGATVRIDTGAFAAELAVGGQEWNEPVPAAAVPGPVVAVWLADDTRFGGSRLYGETPIRRWPDGHRIKGRGTGRCGAGHRRKGSRKLGQARAARNVGVARFGLSTDDAVGEIAGW